MNLNKIGDKKYKFLLFDADGTLLDYDAAEKNALTKVFKTANIDMSDELFSAYRKINKNYWHLFELGEGDKKIFTVKRFEDIFKQFSFSLKDGQSFEAFNKSYLDFLGEGNQLIEGALEVCEALSKNHTLAIITNGIYKTQKNRISSSSLSPFISYMFTSEKVGFSKPDSRFFDAVFDEMKIKDKKDALVIGDSLIADIAGGIGYGLDTCYVNLTGNENESETVPTYEIKSLRDLRLP